MTTGTVVLDLSRTADDADTTARPAIRRFWLFQIAGWLAYAVVMALSRLGIFPLRYIVVSKGVLAITGLLYSLLLWRVYRWLLRRSPSIGQIVVVSVVCSYVVAALWTAADNLLDIPISAWILERDHTIDNVFRLFVGSVYNAFTLLAWSLLYFGVKYYDALQTERERSLRAEALAQKAQLEALRYQLHPHFLFNTLNAVSTLIVEHRNDEASRMIARLSDFLRLTLAAPLADEAPLSDELEFVRRYLEIEHVRFGDRLTARFEVEQDVWTARVPHLILQPLIENAIRHGIALREDGGSLTIAARRIGSRLRIEVANDGFSASTETPTERERIGLANTRQRLRYSYGDDQRLDVETVGSTVRVVIELPFRNSPASA